MITVKEVKTKKERKAFFKFPLDLYKGNKYVVPALISDEEDEFNPEVNDAYRYAETKLFLAYNEQGKVVGRVAGLYHKAYNEKQNVKQLRFTRYDVIDDFAVTEALFAETEAFCREARFLRMHVFAYSRRPGTPAADFPNQVPEPEEHSRSARLIALDRELRADILDGICRAGEPLSVLLETFRDGTVRGHSAEFFEVEAPSDKPLHGELRSLLPVSHDGNAIIGKIL